LARSNFLWMILEGYVLSPPSVDGRPEVFTAQVKRFRRFRWRFGWRLAETAESVRIDARDEVTQGPEGVVVLVPGVFGRRLARPGGRIAVQPGLGQQVGARAAQDLQAASLEPGVDGADAGADAVVARAYLEPQGPQRGGFLSPGGVRVPEHLSGQVRDV